MNTVYLIGWYVMVHMRRNDLIYFTASNTAQGFLNYFEDAFCSDDRVYILKGGPGTGKSYFLKQAAEAAEQRGLLYEKYLCSSDPDSLDGIRIPERGIALFDGTAPHTLEPKLPGAREEILNLGQFWNSGMLRTKREQIKALSDKKAEAYDEALTNLKLAGQCALDRHRILKKHLNSEKMHRAAELFLKKIPYKEGKALPRPMRTFGMRGEYTLETFSRLAQKIFVLSPLYGIEHLYLEILLLAGKEQGREMEYSPHPITPSLPEAVYFPSSGVLVTAMAGAMGKNVGTRRFLLQGSLGDDGSMIRFLLDGERRFINAATDAFYEMRKHHFALEELYGAAMDFDKKEMFTKSFLAELF
ncbi:MAG: hypothetical protein E7616_08165 [Ruminococcaceae bacterium]|nr:hypothetical protein [Oscillospiraceae bacterium]